MQTPDASCYEQPADNADADQDDAYAGQAAEEAPGECFNKAYFALKHTHLATDGERAALFDLYSDPDDYSPDELVSLGIADECGREIVDALTAIRAEVDEGDHRVIADIYAALQLECDDLLTSAYLAYDMKAQDDRATCPEFLALQIGVDFDVLQSAIVFPEAGQLRNLRRAILDLPHDPGVSLDLDMMLESYAAYVHSLMQLRTNPAAFEELGLLNEQDFRNQYLFDVSRFIRRTIGSEASATLIDQLIEDWNGAENSMLVQRNP